MGSRTNQLEAGVGARGDIQTGLVPGAHGRQPRPRLTSEQVWKALAKARRTGSFAILGHVTPSGEPRSSGVVYKTLDGRLYAATARDSWKAKHLAARGRVAVTVTVRRAGILSLVLPIPPATISFHGAAIVHSAGSPEILSVWNELKSLVPGDRRATVSIIEIVPEGEFLTYCVGVPLRKMFDPVAAQARVPVS